MSDPQLRSAIEAILIAAETPLPTVTIAGAVQAPIAEVQSEIEALIKELAEHADGVGRGYEIREVGGGWRVYINQKHDWGLEKLLSSEAPSKLSQAALETLAIIAYRQPISRGQISQIRGVSVDSSIKTLQSRGLIEHRETDQDTGAALFETTQYTLELLAINSLSELPKISPMLPDVGSLDD